MDTARQKKINRSLQKDLGEIFREMQAEFPGTMVTVTYVRISSDLSVARVNLSIFAVSNKEEALKKVKAKGNEIRFHLAKRIRNQLRIVPALYFHLDDTLDQIERIDELLKS